MELNYKNKIKKSVTWGYGAGHFGYGFITQMLVTYFTFYATTILLIPGTLIGLVVAISVVWDAISDPMMGYISDNTKSKFGKRHIYIVAGTILIAITNIALWTIEIEASMMSKFLSILVNIMLIKTFITIFITPYNALGAELSNDYDERSKIQAIKTVFFLIALLSVNAISMFVFFKPETGGQFNPQAYKNMAYTASIAMVITGFITHIATLKYKTVGPVTANVIKTKSHFLDTVKYSLKGEEFRDIFIGYLFTNLASAIISVIGLHTFTYTFLMNTNEIGIIFGVQFIVSIVAQPLWVKISEKIDKQNAVKLGLKISMVGCFILFLLVIFKENVIEHFEYLLSYSIIVGFGISGLFSLPLSMIGDTVDKQEYETGERNEGMYFGMLNFGYKLSQAIAIFLLGILLDIIKFNPNLTIQSDSTAFKLGAVLSLGSLITFALAERAYRKYSLDKEQVMFMQSEIKLRNNHKEAN